ncbi:tryptophan dimethylallyltransferase-domain-containing protein [Aspergillus egyptiacus]|nr:tryptophan dimethylallyltransferase-domain-containing protein [Aspergillus egyptiacus]
MVPKLAAGIAGLFEGSGGASGNTMAIPHSMDSEGEGLTISLGPDNDSQPHLSSLRPSRSCNESDYLKQHQEGMIPCQIQVLYTDGVVQEAMDMSKKGGESLSVWETVFRRLPSRDADSDYWWQVTGPQMATMFEEAGYSKEKQYEYLLIHYHWTVPYMGPKPGTDGHLKWNCILTSHGISMVYSWKWNDSTPSSKPDIRIGFEPISAHTGTALDPLNQLASKEILHSLANRMPLDLTWANHFLSIFFDPETKYWQAKETNLPTPLATTMMLGYDFLQDGLTLKTYFFPRSAGQRLLP